MSTSIQPITLYGGGLGPNPFKVFAILKELSVPFETVYIPFYNVKNPDYVKINPNGRLPAIHDPNTNITLWESGAIIEYLVHHYDPTNLISFPLHSHEDFLTRQYLFFQVSGQGPYYGQARWFKFAPEQLPLAIERYKNEIKRISGVLNSVLEGKEWLVGGKCTYADLSFIPWQVIASDVLSDEPEFLATTFPNVEAWINRMKERDSIKAAEAEAEKAMVVYLRKHAEWKVATEKAEMEKA